MSAKILNICVPLKRAGTEKTDWHTIGTITLLDTGNGHLNLKSIPLGAWDGHANLFPIKERGGYTHKEEPGKADGWMPEPIAKEDGIKEEPEDRAW